VNCRDFTMRAAAWLDGELPEGERDELQAHAAECPDCARLAGDLRAADAALGVGPAPERSEKEWDAFDRALMVRIAMEEKGRAARARDRLRRAWRTALRGAAAAAALFAAGIVGYAIRGGRPERTGGGAADGPPVVRDGAVAPASDPADELRRVLAASERILIRLTNADASDPAELSAIRSAVLDAGIPARLAELRRTSARNAPVHAAVRPVEIIFVRVANGSPREPGEFREIRNAVLDSALLERMRVLRSSM
jgi:hypothetical protein